MLMFEQILAQYPENLQTFKESILKEYLQYKILNSIFNSDYSNRLVFLGGTALRIIYGNTRFSQDLDFDNFNLTEQEFGSLSQIIQRDLTLEGLEVETTIVTPKAYRIKIRIPKILFELGLSSLKEHKMQFF